MGRQTTQNYTKENNNIKECKSPAKSQMKQVPQVTISRSEPNKSMPNWSESSCDAKHLDGPQKVGSGGDQPSPSPCSATKRRPLRIVSLAAATPAERGMRVRIC